MICKFSVWFIFDKNINILPKFKEPVVIYIIDEPNKIKPEAIAPNIKYLRAASAETGDLVFEAAKI